MTVTTHPFLPKTLAVLEKLIGFRTISGTSNLEMIEYCSNFLEAAGAEIHLWKNENKNQANLLASFGGNASLSNGIVLSGHSDVVPVDGQTWASDPFTLSEKNNRLYGRGTCDMKGFIAASMIMASEIARHGITRPLSVAVTFDEETGCFGGQQLIRDLERDGLKPSVCIVGEPTEMRIIEGHKGCYEYTTKFRGLATHGSLTHQGVNAIEYATRYIARLMEIREELKNSSPEAVRFDPPYTTLQIGQISGGTSRNTIAGDCKVEWEMRPVRSEDAEFVKTHINDFVSDKLLPEMRERYPDASIEQETIAEVIGLEPASDSEAKEICQSLTGKSETDFVSFGTEAGLYQEYGVSTVVCGPGSIEQAHKPDEYIEKSELVHCLNMLENLGKMIR